MSRLVQMHQSKGTREELEPAVLALAVDEPVFYLGVQGPSRKSETGSGDDAWPVHTWRIGEAESAVNPAYVPELKAEAKHRQDTAIYRQEVWTGDGPPGPVMMPAREAEPVAVEFPAPLMTSCSAEGSALRPQPVIDLAAYAGAHGWDTMTTYAYGWLPHASWGTPSAQPKESWGVRMRRGGDQAVAVRMGGTWASMWTWSSSDTFVHHKTLAAFREAIS